MVKQNVFSNIAIFLIIFLIIIILLSIITSLNKLPSGMNSRSPETCYDECRMDGNSMYYCNRICNPNSYSKYGYLKYDSPNDYYRNVNGPIQSQEQNVIINPLPSESNGGNGPVEPVVNNTTELVDPIDQPTVEEPAPAIPVTVAETFLI